VSYSAAARTLNDWRNRRRANRANGLIPQLEEELSGLDGTLREMEQTRRRKAEAEQELARLEERQRELQGDLEIWARLERHDLNRRYAEAYMEWEAAKANLPEDKPHPVFGTMTGEEAWAFAQEKQEERNAALAENQKRETQQAEAEKQYSRGRQEMLIGGFLGGTMLLWFVTHLLDGVWLLAAMSGVVVLSGIYCLFHGRRLTRQARGTQAACQPVPVPETGNLLNQAAEYRETLAAAQQAKAAEAAARRRVEDLAAQGGQLADTLEMLYSPAQSRAATAAQLAATERELARVRDELARAEGILAHMGGPEDIEARRGELDAQLTQRLEEYDALTTALEALSAANDALRQRFSPALNQKAGVLFAALTGGRWPKLTLARDFSAQAAAEDTLPRSSLALSTGTAEQLYLAVRLAVCALTVPDAPIVLDDALTAFDDARCALALKLLKGQARERQILLFSCHSREEQWAAAHGVPVIRLS
ncbi:MAG: hypothetical protein K2M15_10320, partial [Oscillospiraceae bacterium]|nr:hypothetical protein [Oscillospiraceae bacterium]